MAFFSFLSWFRPWWKSTETDFETVLARLSKDIAAVQTRLTRVHTRQRRATVTLTIYAFVVWALYAAVIWFLDPWGAQQAGGGGGGERDEREEDGSTLSSQQTRWLFSWGPVLAGPIVILSTRRVVSWWYRRIADGEEKHLRSLQRTRRKKVDEIKLATRYDHLKMLLEKYDDTNPRNAAAAAATSKAGQARMQAQQRKQAPAGGVQGSGGGRLEPARDARQFQGKIDGRPLERGGSASSSQQIQFPPSQNQPQQPQQVQQQQQAKMNVPISTTASAQAPAQQVPYHKTFLDRLADVMLGADPSSTAGGASNAAEQRYALICHICFNHNGLCHRDQWDEVQYICPRCGTFNTNRPSTVPVSSPWASSPPSSRLRTQSSLSNFGQTREKAQDGRHQNRASLGHLPSESSSSHLLVPSGSPLRQDLGGQEADGADGKLIAKEDAEEASDSSTIAFAGENPKHADGAEEDVVSTLRSRGTRGRGERPSSPVMDVD